MSRVSSVVSYLVRTLMLSDQGPTFMTSFHLSYFLFQIQPTGFRASTYELRENANTQSLTASFPGSVSPGKPPAHCPPARLAEKRPGGPFGLNLTFRQVLK